MFVTLTCLEAGISSTPKFKPQVLKKKAIAKPVEFISEWTNTIDPVKQTYCNTSVLILG